MPYRQLYPGVIAVALLAGAALWLPSARAADLGYGVTDAGSAIAETKVEFGTGWYVRGDIAATERYNVSAQRASADTEAFGVIRANEVGYDLSLGGGYSFTNGIRADITADFHQPGTIEQDNQPCITVATSNCTAYGKYTGYDALANIYYDFGTWYRVTPYVGAGAGIGFGQPNARLAGDPSGTYFARFGYQNFAFALMAGVAFNVYDHVKLDIGYRYLNNGSVVGTRVDFQEVRAGIRYMIDN